MVGRAEDFESEWDDDDPLLMLDVVSRRGPWDNRPMRTRDAVAAIQRVSTALTPGLPGLRMPEPSITSTNRELSREDVWVLPPLPPEAFETVDQAPHDDAIQRVFGVSPATLVLVAGASAGVGCLAAFAVFRLVGER
jgi:hypothetical protein